jgi:hypothetical protein
MGNAQLVGDQLKFQAIVENSDYRGSKCTDKKDETGYE